MVEHQAHLAVIPIAFQVQSTLARLVIGQAQRSNSGRPWLQQRVALNPQVFAHVFRVIAHDGLMLRRNSPRAACHFIHLLIRILWEVVPCLSHWCGLPVRRHRLLKESPNCLIRCLILVVIFCRVIFFLHIVLPVVLPIVLALLSSFFLPLRLCPCFCHGNVLTAMGVTLACRAIAHLVLG